MTLPAGRYRLFGSDREKIGVSEVYVPLQKTASLSNDNFKWQKPSDGLAMRGFSDPMQIPKLQKVISFGIGPGGAAIEVDVTKKTFQTSDLSGAYAGISYYGVNQSASTVGLIGHMTAIAENIGFIDGINLETAVGVDFGKIHAEHDRRALVRFGTRTFFFQKGATRRYPSMLSFHVDHSFERDPEATTILTYGFGF